MELQEIDVANSEEVKTQDSLLPPSVAVRCDVSIPLIEIPFEITRQELIQVYLLSIGKCIHADELATISAQNVVSHLLFLKSLAAIECDKKQKNQLRTFAKKLGRFLESAELSLWNIASRYIQESQFPIIRWLVHQSPSLNFIATFIIEKNCGLLTRNQSAFLRQFEKSAAFFFPDLLYMLWLTQSYKEDSNEKLICSSCKINYYSDVTDNLLLRTQPKQIKFAAESYYEQEKESINSNFRYLMSQKNLLRIQGRTLLFINKSSEVIAVKVQKKVENKSNFSEEYQITNYLIKHQRRLNLQSELPQPLGLYSIKRTEILENCNHNPDYEQFIELISDMTELDVYVYKAPLAYFTYLHDEQQTFSELASSLQKNIHDLFVLLKEGIVFPQLADIFHTGSDKDCREDMGRYYTLVQLLKVCQPHLGRIDKWQKAVEFVNLRVSGLADLGDNLPITSLFTPSEFTKKYFPEILRGGYHQTFFDQSSGTASSLFTGKRKLFGNYLYLNTIAEYLLVIQLTLGAYGNKVTRKIGDLVAKKAVWQQLAELMFHSCAEVVALMAGIPQSKALELLSQRAKIDKHAQQIQFWMTPDYADLNSSEIKMQQYMLYPGESGYEINDELVPGVGLSVDGIHQDLGGYNQSLPLKEFEKLLYATVTLIEGTIQLDKQFFLAVSASKLYDCHQATVNLMEIARSGCHFPNETALFYSRKETR
ncbi:substrate of the Dot/Icm secretion system [Legionella gratiana]|uniref:Substrate of the Dot/Icm secretion system n=1 Tax=Legionella gratiana TaxID=45066 RepID=A0A378J512_9GAMM|nr:SidJ family T4SS effector polyglutamylation protein [Legionella gratiana]KTD06092.1 substrate of the Dot/Icm secretion system [Legionella gratiana]STX42822.1 substrate of the Dot/Icm secretion system [Legionella gratiana]